jgi:hypothetical protein
VLDTTAGTELGYVPAGDSAATVAAEVDWLGAASGAGRLRLDEEFFAGSFDYAAEHAYLAGRSG